MAIAASPLSYCTDHPVKLLFSEGMVNVRQIAMPVKVNNVLSLAAERRANERQGRTDHT